MTRKTIQLFMWGYQEHFRLEVQRRAKEVISRIAPGVQGKALLVGVRTSDTTEGHSVCVEPENGPWDPALFSQCEKRTDEIFRVHPGQNMSYGDQPSMDDKPENIRRASVLESVKEVLEKYDLANSTVSFCGAAARIAGYHVVPILQFPNVQLSNCARLAAPFVYEDYVSPVGLLETTVSSVLADATMKMFLPEPGRSFRSLVTDPDAILRDAGDRFCSCLALATHDPMLQGVFDVLNVISALPYEGAGAMGEIVFAPKEHPSIDLDIALNTPVSLYAPRLARKAIEMSGNGLAAICCGYDGILGLGVLNDNQARDVLKVRFTGHYKWLLIHRDRVVMRVEFGVPKLPVVRLTDSDFSSQVKRQFVGIDDAAVALIWSVVEEALEQRHGTMIVVSSDAASEAIRLGSQSMPIRPTHLTPQLVSRITGIDGAVLLGIDGACYGIGVILDGHVSNNGDPSRGARFNSALRYASDNPAKAMCVVVSEDGYVDLVPTLKAQVSRSAVVERVALLKTLGVDDYHVTRSWLEDHRFYLTAEQCDVVNSELARIHSAAEKAGEIRWVTSTFSPRAEMDETYYTD